MNPNTLLEQTKLIKGIRDFFEAQAFVDIISPALVENPGMETHIHPMKVNGVIDNKFKGYLHTSPEFFLKKVLSLNSDHFDKIFSIAYCYRDEPYSTHHRNQFLMLEWYRKYANYMQIMQDTEDLIISCSKIFSRPLSTTDFTRRTVQEIFQEILNVDILEYLEIEKIKNLIKNNFPDVPMPEQKLSWDDYYFLLFLNKVEPELKRYRAIFLYEFPAPLAALSTLKQSDLRVCERFEIYFNGIELANCYNELTDIDEQKKRFDSQAKEKKSLYHYQLNAPAEFYETLERGLPISAGIALGIERLHMALTNNEDKFLF